MFRILFFAVLAASFAATSQAARLDPSARQQDRDDSDNTQISKQDVLRAIAIFRRDPLNVQAEMTQPIILKFAKDSPDVEVSLDQKHLTWFENKALSDENRRTLLTAFIAGDVQAQLDRGHTKDDPVAATEQLIATYRQMKKANRSLKVAEIEEFIELQKDGKLAERLK